MKAKLAITTPPITPESAAELVRQGRRPLIQIVLTSSMDDIERQTAEMMFFIPPKGTKPGDTIEGRSPGTNYIFRGSKGEYRGKTDTQSVPFKEGRRIRRQIEDMLRSEGIDTSSTISYTLKRTLRWLSELPMQ